MLVHWNLPQAYALPLGLAQGIAQKQVVDGGTNLPKLSQPAINGSAIRAV